MEISTSFTFFKHGKILIAKLQREKDMFLVDKYKNENSKYKQGKKTTTNRTRKNANRKILKGKRCVWLTNTNKKMTNTKKEITNTKTKITNTHVKRRNTKRKIRNTNRKITKGKRCAWLTGRDQCMAHWL